MTCEYEVTGSGVEDTEFSVSAGIVELGPTGLVTGTSAAAAVGVLLLLVLAGIVLLRR